jgi:hypothetical protein
VVFIAVYNISSLYGFGQWDYLAHLPSIAIFAGIAGAVSANAHPLLFVGIIEVVNIYSPSFAGMPMVVSEEKINWALLEGLIMVA